MINSPGLLNIHVGAPYYFGDNLIETLMAIQKAEKDPRISIPHPDHYQGIITRKASGEMGGYFTPVELENLTNTLKPDCENLILSFSSLLGGMTAMFDGDVIYPDATDRVAFIRKLFPNKTIRITLTVANPMTILAGMLMEKHPVAVDPKDISRINPLWCEMIKSLSDHFPEIDFAVCPMEEAHVTWSCLLRRMLSWNDNRAVPGSLNMALCLLSNHGRRVLKETLESSPPRNENELANTIEMVCDSYADPRAIELEVDLPGWDQDIINRCDDVYQEDISTCAEAFSNVIVIDREALQV